MNVVAAELAKGGAYVAWFIVVVEAGVIGTLFTTLIKAYKDDGKEMTTALDLVNKTQIQHTMILNHLLDMLKAIQSVFMNGGLK